MPPLLLMMVVACSGPADSPETEIRQFIARAQVASEERNLRDLRALIADDYADAQGRDRKAVENLIRLHVLRHQSVHLFTRIGDIVFTDPDHATVSVAAAMAGRPVVSADQLIGLNADLYRFDFALVRRGRDDWQVLRVAWEQAKLDDFW
ncbi:MAG: hypothetical protein P9E24_07455 [Candidatus Competibacter sp.]|nr:hypothetical protein [Candidatus Competibacter sp.]MDG4584747.1 hypothetical protein [Candidatus Competibacter sp.]